MSMDFSPPRRAPRGESIVPMINVVFLLLIFFLMTSSIAPPEPFQVNPPETAEGKAADPAPVLYLSETGEIAFEDARGDDAVRPFVARASEDAATAQLRAAAGVEASSVARLMRDLAGAGLAQVSLVVAAEK